MKLYIETGIRPGDFLSCVIKNDLYRSFAFADEMNLPRLWEIVSWLYEHAPTESWGNHEHFRDWMKHRKEERENEKSKTQETGA